MKLFYFFLHVEMSTFWKTLGSLLVHFLAFGIRKSDVCAKGIESHDFRYSKNLK